MPGFSGKNIFRLRDFLLDNPKKPRTFVIHLRE